MPMSQGRRGRVRREGSIGHGGGEPVLVVR